MSRNREQVLLALERVKGRVKTNDSVTGLMCLLVWTTVYLLIVIVVDQAQPLERQTRLWLVGGFGAVGLLALAFVLLWPTLRRVNDLFAARLIERQAENQFRNSLVSFVELEHQAGVPEEIREAVAAKAARDLREVDIELVVSRRPVVWATWALLATLALVAFFAIVTPKSFTTSVGRAMGFAISPPTATRILEVAPADGAAVMEGEDVLISAALAGEQPRQVAARLTRDGKYWDTVPMRSASEGRWELSVTDLRADLRFRVQAGDARSDERLVKVLPLPAVTEVRTRLTYPEYTMRGVETRGTGNVEALVGTRVEVLARANVPLREAPQLVFGDGGRKLVMFLEAAGPDASTASWAGATEARGSFAVDKDDSYLVRFYDPVTRRANAAPLCYQIKALSDRPPTVEFAGAAATLSVPANGGATLAARACDDYGLDRLTFAWRVESAGPARGKEYSLLVRAAPKDQAVLLMPQSFMVRPAGLGLMAGQQATCWFAATDRRPAHPGASRRAGIEASGPAGAQEGRSDEFRLVVTAPKKPPTATAGQGSSPTAGAAQAAATPGAGATQQASPSAQASVPKTAGLSPDEQQALDRMRGALEKLEQLLAAQQGGEPAQPPGSAATSPGQEPGEEKGPPNKQPGSSSAGQATPGEQGTPAPGPAADQNDQPGTRPPDEQLPERRQQFTESGVARPGPQTDAQLLQSVGPRIRRLDEELRQGTVDPELLKSLGWDEARLRSFVSEFKDRFGDFAGGAGAVGQTPPAVQPAVGEVKVVPGAPGPVGAGQVPGEHTTAGDGAESIEVQKRRVSPRFTRLVEEYLKAVSEAETGAAAQGTSGK